MSFKMSVPHKVKAKNYSRLKEAEGTWKMQDMILHSILYLRWGEGECCKDTTGDIDYCVNVTFTEVDNCGMVV